MTDQIPNPLPSHAMILDDDGMPSAVMNIDKMQSDSIILAYEMAASCNDKIALDALSAHWLEKVGVDGFGYVAAGALRLLAQYVLDPTLDTLEAAAPGLGNTLRLKLCESANHAQDTL